MTGGAGGIGQATAQLFLDEGATVVLVDVNESALEKARDALTGGEESVHIIQADVTEEEDVKRYVDETVSKFGKIDVFFNNAGINGPFKEITELEKETFNQIMNINVTGVFLGLKYVIKQMNDQATAVSLTRPQTLLTSVLQGWLAISLPNMRLLE